jgi:uracil-DNA glycosylase family 4
MGFFFAEANESKSKQKKTIPLNAARELGCRVCPLKKESKHPDLLPNGSEHPAFYFLGDAPDYEDEKNQQIFSGELGEMIKKQIPAKWRDHVRFNTIVRSAPPSNRKPHEVEIECCRNSIIADIEKAKPAIVIPLGTVALQWTIQQSDVAKWRGRFVPGKIGQHVCWLYPMYHPKDIAFRQRISSTGNVIQTEWDHIFVFDFKTLFESV